MRFYLTRKYLTWLCLVLLAALVVLALGGCSGTRLSAGQAQALAEARSGALVADAERAKPEPDWQRIADLYTGTTGFLIAATQRAEIPPATFTPDALTAADGPQRFAEAGRYARAHPPKGWGAGTWAAVLTGSLGAVGIVLRLSRNLPGVAGLAGGILNSLWTVFAPDKAKAEEAKLDRSLDVAVAYGQRLTEMATAAGLTDRVESVKHHAAMLAERLGLREEIDRRLERTKTYNPLVEDLPPRKPT